MFASLPLNVFLLVNVNSFRSSGGNNFFCPLTGSTNADWECNGEGRRVETTAESGSEGGVLAYNPSVCVCTTALGSAQGGQTGVIRMRLIG